MDVEGVIYTTIRRWVLARADRCGTNGGAGRQFCVASTGGVGFSVGFGETQPMRGLAEETVCLCSVFSNMCISIDG